MMVDLSIPEDILYDIFRTKNKQVFDETCEKMIETVEDGHKVFAGNEVLTTIAEVKDWIERKENLFNQ